jgi:hypothetical protein
VRVSPTRSFLEGTDGVDLVEETIRTNNLAVNVGPVKMAIKTVESHLSVITYLGAQVYDNQDCIEHSPGMLKNYTIQYCLIAYTFAGPKSANQILWTA